MWEEVCEERGNCFYFDKTQLGATISLLCFAYKLLSIICLVLAWKLYKPPTQTVQIVLDIITPDDVKPTNNGQVPDVTNDVFSQRKAGVLNGAANVNEDTQCWDVQVSRL